MQENSSAIVLLDIYERSRNKALLPTLVRQFEATMRKALALGYTRVSYLPSQHILWLLNIMDKELHAHFNIQPLQERALPYHLQHDAAAWDSSRDEEEIDSADGIIALLRDRCILSLTFHSEMLLADEITDLVFRDSSEREDEEDG